MRGDQDHQVIKMLRIWSQREQLELSHYMPGPVPSLLSGLQGHIFHLCRCSFTLGELSPSTVRVDVCQEEKKKIK